MVHVSVLVLVHLSALVLVVGLFVNLVLFCVSFILRLSLSSSLMTSFESGHALSLRIRLRPGL